jgi:hypothetical protein
MSRQLTERVSHTLKQMEECPLPNLENATDSERFQMLMRARLSTAVSLTTGKSRPSKEVSLASLITSEMLKVYSRSDISHPYFHNVEKAVIRVAERGILLKAGINFVTRNERKLAKNNMERMIKKFRQEISRVSNFTWDSLPARTKADLVSAGVDSKAKFDRLDAHVRSEIFKSAKTDQSSVAGHWEQIKHQVDPDIREIFQGTAHCHQGMAFASYMVLLVAVYWLAVSSISEVLDYDRISEQVAVAGQRVASIFQPLSLNEIIAMSEGRTRNIPEAEVEQTVWATFSNAFAMSLTNIEGSFPESATFGSMYSSVADWLGFDAAVRQTAENLGAGNLGGYLARTAITSLVRTYVGTEVTDLLLSGIVHGLLGPLIAYLMYCAFLTFVKLGKATYYASTKASATTFMSTIGIPIAAAFSGPVVGASWAAAMGVSSLLYGLHQFYDPSFSLAKGFFGLIGIHNGTATLYGVSESQLKRKRSVKDENTKYIQDFLNGHLDLFADQVFGERPTKRRLLENPEKYREDLKKFSTTALQKKLENISELKGTERTNAEVLREIYLLQLSVDNFENMDMASQLDLLDKTEALLKTGDRQVRTTFKKALTAVSKYEKDVSSRMVKLSKILDDPSIRKKTLLSTNIASSESYKKHVEDIGKICKKPATDVMRIFRETKGYVKDETLPPSILKAWYEQLGCLRRYSAITLFIAVQLQKLEENVASTQNVFIVTEDDKFEPHPSWRMNQLVPICTGWADQPVLMVGHWKRIIKSGWTKREYQGHAVSMYQWLQAKSLLSNPTSLGEDEKIPLADFCEQYAKSLEHVPKDVRRRYCMSPEFRETVQKFYGTKCDVKGKGAAARTSRRPVSALPPGDEGPSSTLRRTMTVSPVSKPPARKTYSPRTRSVRKTKGPWPGTLRPRTARSIGPGDSVRAAPSGRGTSSGPRKKSKRPVPRPPPLAVPPQGVYSHQGVPVDVSASRKRKKTSESFEVPSEISQPPGGTSTGTQKRSKKISPSEQTRLTMETLRQITGPRSRRRSSRRSMTTARK